MKKKTKLTPLAGTIIATASKKIHAGDMVYMGKNGKVRPATTRRRASNSVFGTPGGASVAEGFLQRVLMKYIQHVRQCEGIDFIARINDRTESDVLFEPDEEGIMKRLSDVVDRLKS